jgi:aldehyde dehydrogenase (NAD+)
MLHAASVATGRQVLRCCAKLKIVEAILKELGLEAINSGVFAGEWLEGEGGEWTSVNPANGMVLGKVRLASAREYERAVGTAQCAFLSWRMLPAPRRGEVIRQIGEALRAKKEALGALVAMECGKIRAEGEGEVQEMIDMADFAVGLSRQLYGLTMATERPGHRMYEQWHPLGPVGIITAFNFPVAVWAWNALLSAVCGNPNLWKPSPDTPLTAVAVQKICNEVTARHGVAGIFSLVCGDVETVGEPMANDARLPLISATGSCAMGKKVAATVAKRLGRSLLELGGNNAIIVTAEADLELASRAIFFAAVGTAGQRCTSLRRLIVHRSIAASLKEKLLRLWKQVRIGDPLEASTLMGPLIHAAAVQRYVDGIAAIEKQGGRVLCGGKTLQGNYVEPTIVEANKDMTIMQDEIFAPILYVLEFEDLDEAIALQNGVPQGLSSAIFTRSMMEAERFLSPSGSDCGIANVNIGTSGAEIGGAFGGEKETGGGRESGSDSWKAYMRRQTVTINYSKELPLAQGIRFEI